MKADHPQIAARWTPKLAARGWTSVANVFLDAYSRLRPKITHGEAMFIIHLMQHKWDHSAPFPSYRRLAKKMGLKEGAVRLFARSLESKGYLFREFTRKTNRFHLKGLFAALEQQVNS